MGLRKTDEGILDHILDALGFVIDGLINLFRPKWRHTDSQVREAAVGRLTDPRLLTRIAQKDESLSVRGAAVQKLADHALLAAIAQQDESDWVREAAVEKLTDNALLSEIAQKDQSPSVRKAAVRKITDHALLAAIAQTDAHEDVRYAAVCELTDQTVLAEIAKTDPEEDVRKRAMDNLTDQALLAEVALSGKYNGADAVSKLTDQSLIAEVAKRSGNGGTRLAAARMLADQELVQSVYAEIARTDDDRYRSLEAVWKLTDKSVLAELALNSRHPEVRRNAVSQLKDPSALIEVVRSEVERTNTDDWVCVYAAGRITNQALLAEIAWTERSRANKLAEILGRFSRCALCGEWWETEKLDWKHRCGGCSGAS